jgi:hypothetical protein
MHQLQRSGKPCYAGALHTSHAKDMFNSACNIEGLQHVDDAESIGTAMVESESATVKKERVVLIPMEHREILFTVVEIFFGRLFLFDVRNVIFEEYVTDNFDEVIETKTACFAFFPIFGFDESERSLGVNLCIHGVVIILLFLNGGH